MNISLLLNDMTPKKQWMIIAGVFLIAILIGAVTQPSALEAPYSTHMWEIFATFLLFYVFTNTLISLRIEYMKNYWRNSIIGFLTFLIVGFGITHVLSHVPIQEAGNMRWMVFLFVFVYFLVISIVRAMRAIIEYVQEQDAKLRGESE